MLLLNHFSQFQECYAKEKERRRKLRENNDPFKNINYIGKKANREKTIRKRARRAEQIKQRIELGGAIAEKEKNSNQECWKFETKVKRN